MNFEYTLYKPDKNNRSIDIYSVENARLTGYSLFYPNVLLYDGNTLHNPVQERVMSLQNSNNKQFEQSSPDPIIDCVDTPVFYFIYNTDNYYHFIYDTVPYLISYLDLKRAIPNLKLLMNYSNETRHTFYDFVTEFLDLIGICNSDVVIAKKCTLYKKIYISSSYTHGIDSNLPPREEVYDFFRNVVKRINLDINTPKKVYISRRTWIHNDFSNIGTNYTTRRTMKNEDRLVEELRIRGYEEVFTERLSTIEKIHLFANAENVVGAIGGGLVNVLFSNNDCKLIAIVSPTFLDVNKRFMHSFSKVKTTYFTDTQHTETDEFKKYMRVQCGNVVGEIVNILENELVIMYSESPVAGWSNEMKYNTISVPKNTCHKLDAGLNSSYIINLKGLLNLL